MAAVSAWSSAKAVAHCMRQVAGQYDGTALVTLGDDVAEQVCLFTPER